MSIVNWGKQEGKVEISSGTEDDLDLMAGILRLDINNSAIRWRGDVIYKKNLKVVEPLHVSIVLRKNIKDTAVKIVIDINVTVSANGKMIFSPDELQEMNLAILEAQNVLANYRANGWEE